MKASLKHSPIFFIIFIVAACGGKPSANQEKETDQAALQEEKTIHDIEQLLEDMPPPSLIPFSLKSIGAAFDKALTNDFSKMDAYKANFDKMALNMGVYASDISYFAAYGHEEDCLDYLRKAHEMAEFLGDSAIYGEEELQEFQGHITNQNDEEISKILSKLFLETSVKLEQDHHLTMAGLALTGSFVEGLYQAVKTIESYPATKENNKLLEPLVKIVMNEEQALLDIIQVLDDLPFDDTIADIMTELSILDRLYKGDLKDIEAEMKNNPDYIVTKDAMRDITLEVKRIRESIVE